MQGHGFPGASRGCRPGLVLCTPLIITQFMRVPLRRIADPDSNFKIRSDPDPVFKIWSDPDTAIKFGWIRSLNFIIVIVHLIHV